MKEITWPVELLVLDFDGVMTDNKVLVFEDGKEAVVCSRADGHGIGILKRLGVPMFILSTEPNPVVARRAEKLGLTCFHGVADKKELLLSEVKKRGVDLQNTLFLGNDTNDISAMEVVGTSVAVCDAAPEVLKIADHVLELGGGEGAVRELARKIRKAKQGESPDDD